MFAARLGARIVIVFEDKFRHKQWAVEIGKRIAEPLRRVHAPQRIQIGGIVFADSQRGVSRAGFLSRGQPRDGLLAFDFVSSKVQRCPERGARLGFFVLHLC